MDVYLIETHKIAQTNHSLIYLPDMSRLITNNTFYYVRKVKIKQHSMITKMSPGLESFKMNIDFLSHKANNEKQML